MVRRAVDRMPDYSATFQVVPWARAKDLTKKGKAFAIFPPYFHAHDWLTDDTKEPYIWPYFLALHFQSDVVICNEEVVVNAPKPNFPEDYKGLTFVMFRGDGRAGPKFYEMVERGEITLQHVNKTDQIFPILQAKRSDCTATSELPFKWNIRKLKISGNFHNFDKRVRLITTAVINLNEGYLGYTNVDDEKNFPFKQDFAIKFDIEIYKMIKSGEKARIVNAFISN